MLHCVSVCCVLLQAKQEVKDQPRDDAEVERKEEKDIDHVFVESSSGSEDEELTESGKNSLVYMTSVCGVWFNKTSTQSHSVTRGDKYHHDCMLNIKQQLTHSVAARELGFQAWSSSRFKMCLSVCLFV